MDGMEATWRLRERWPEARALILTTFDDNDFVFEGLQAGAVTSILQELGPARPRAGSDLSSKQQPNAWHLCRAAHLSNIG
jgi:DNA-binding NarL/FixJ family response regulator